MPTEMPINSKCRIQFCINLFWTHLTYNVQKCWCNVGPKEISPEATPLIIFIVKFRFGMLEGTVRSRKHAET